MWILFIPACRSPPDYAAHQQERATKKARLAAEAVGAASAAGTAGTAAAGGTASKVDGGSAIGSSAAQPHPMAVDCAAAPAGEAAAAPAAQQEAAVTLDSPSAGGPEEEGAPVVTYAEYYAQRWGKTVLSPEQPLLVAAQVSRQQLARGLDLRRSRKRPYALPACEGEGGPGATGRWA